MFFANSAIVGYKHIGAACSGGKEPKQEFSILIDTTLGETSSIGINVNGAMH
jgi:hypothetical protein